MPYLATYLISIGWSAFAAYAAAAVVELVAMVLVSKLLQPNSQGSQLSNGSTEEYTGTVEPRRIVYGTNLLSGLNAIPPWCSGTNNQMLHQVLVLCGHKVHAITDVFLNQEVVFSSLIGSIVQSTNDGAIGSGHYAGKIWVRRHTGAAGELADAILMSAFPGFWDASHVGVGLAKLYIQYAYDTAVYSAGKPDVRCITMGKELYDPRLDITPGANPFNAAYIAYSDNPALCAIDYILDPVLGIGEASTRIDWVAAVAAANTCDELVTVPLLSTLVASWDPFASYVATNQVQRGGIVYSCVLANVNIAPPNVTYWSPVVAGTVTQRRYTCNTVLDCTQPYENNLKTIAGAFQGAVLYTSGKWVLLPGHWQTPTFAIVDDDIVGQLDFQTAMPYKDRYNAVRGQFYDPANLYQPNEYPPVRVSADEIADGEGPTWREHQQASCISTFEAQRNAMILQRKSRRKKTWSFPATYGLYGIRPGDFGTLSITELGISLQYVRCTGWKLDGKAMTVLLALEEVNPADWYDPATALYQAAGNLLTPAPASFISDPVGSLTGTGGAGGITFHWTLPAIWHSNLSVELLESASNDIAFATMIWSGVNTGVYIQKTDTTVRYYWVRIRNLAGNTTSTTNPIGPSAGLAVAASSAGGPGPTGPTGPAGSGALVGSLTQPAIVLPADAAGHVTNYAAALGSFKVRVGTVDVTAACSFQIAPLGNPSNLTFTIGANSDFGVVLTYEAGQSTDAVGNTAAGVQQVTTYQAQAVLGVGATTGGGAVITFEAQSLTGVGASVGGSNTAVTAEAQGCVGVATVAAAGGGSTAEAQSAVLAGFAGAVAVGATAEAQSAGATGGAGGGTWDAAAPTWDTGATLTWDASDSSGGGAGAPVIGNAVTGE